VAVTIPKQLLEELNLKEGSEVFIEEENDKLTIQSKSNMLASDIDAEFVQIVDRFIDEHEDVLKELAKR